MVRLTEMNGDPIYILPTWIQFIRKARSYEPQGGTRVMLSGESITVRESVEVIVALLGAKSPPDDGGLTNIDNDRAD